MTTNPNPGNGTEPKKEDLEPKPPQPSAPADPIPPAPPADTVDYEKKFSESTRENQILMEQNKKLQDDLKRRETTNEPTDSELQAAFPEIDWELADAATKRLARETFHTRKISEALLEKENAREADAKWNRDIDFAIAKTPELDGRGDAFKEFANKPSHRGVATDILVDAFLNRTKPAMDKPNPNPAPKPGLEPGNGGPRTEEKPQVLSGAELKKLRESDGEKYREYIKTHDITDLGE